MPRGGGKANEELFKQLRRWYRADIAHAEKWREHAREDFDFYNNHQWDKQDLARLAEERRPASEFNRIHAMVDAVVGTERNNKRKVQFIPRTVGKAVPSELLTGAADWFRDQACAAHTDSSAFKDCVISGMGWTSTSLNFEDNPEGQPVIEHLDPLKMAWDCNARKVNLKDATRLWFIDRKPIDVAREMFPNIEDDDLDANWHDSKMITEPEGSYDYGYYADEKNEPRKYVTIIECRWFKREKFYRAPDLETGGLREYSEKEYKLLRQALGDDFIGNEFQRRVGYRAFLGKKILEEPTVLFAPNGQLGWECITGYYDNQLCHHYGVVRTAKEPQRWANKFFSQMMHILNCTAKGGFLVEAGTFENPREAMEALTQPDGIVVLNQGAIAGQKIQLKPTAQMPSGYLALFSEARDAIPNVTGLSREFMGTREVDQAGVLEEQRRQSSFNLLAELFDSIELYRIRQGKAILHLIQNYLSDGRLVRICGDRDAQYVPLIREEIINVEYDIIIDDAPLTPNQKDRTFLVFMQMLPVLREILPPEVLPDIVMDFMSYSPLPATDWERIKERVQQAVMMRQQMGMPIAGEVTGGAAKAPEIATQAANVVSAPMAHLPMDINKQ